jgi:uncharacterized protein (TIGR00369 family)
MGAGTGKQHQPLDPDYERRVRDSFGRQAFMATLGARLVAVEPGRVVIEVLPRPDLTQQHGFLHAGVVASIADTACGYAAFSLMPAQAGVLSVEFKLNLLAPAVGERLLAIGVVVKAGRTLSVCSGEVVAERAGTTSLVALMQATMMTVLDRPGVAG